MTTATSHHRSGRGWVRGVAISAVALGLTLTVVSTNRVSAAVASSGELTVASDIGGALTSGGSSTAFSLSYSGAACPGDSASGGYKVQSFFVGDTVDPASLTYSGTGLVGSTKNPPFKWVLSSNTGTQFKNVNTAVTTGVLTNLPLFSFATLTAGSVPAGTYRLGYACTLNGAVAKYWDKTFTFVADGVDPLGVVWTAAAVGSTTTTSSTTTSSSTTTTTVAGTTTTSTVAESSTTAAASSTSAAASSSSSIVDSTIANSSTTAVGGAGGGGGLVSTGNDATRWVVWGLIALVLGRIVVLIARRVRVVPTDQK